MYSWKEIIGGLGIAAVIILSSVPLIVYEEPTQVSESLAEVDYCNSNHGKNEAECRADKEHHCAWCVSRAVAAQCFDPENAHKLPPSVFKCEFNLEDPIETA